jgi:hypothetical protein
VVWCATLAFVGSWAFITLALTLMIWLSICYVAHAGMNTLQPMICYEIPLQLLFWRVEFMYKGVSHLFPYHIWRQVDIVITRDGFWTLVDVVIINLICIDLMQCVSTTITFVAIIVVQDNTILHRTSSKRWFHSPCHRDLWLSPSSFWFLFYFLCTC